MKYKLIVLDLDGTLTNSKKVITPRNREILIRVQEQGVRLVLASGRPTHGIVPLANELRMNEFGGFILSYNGGEIINWETQEMIYENVLPNDVVPVLYECARSHQLSILTYDGAEIVTENSQDPYVQKEAFLNKMAVRETNDFLTDITLPVAKCLIVGDADKLIPLEAELCLRLQGRINVFRSEPYFLELVPQGIDKALSLAVLLKEIGVERKEMIAIGSDHGGFELKGHIIEHLKEKGIEVKDFGTYSEASVDYPDCAKPVCKAVLDGECECGILICGTGIGISMAANKFKGIRAALCGDVFSAKMSKEHNNANVICMGGRVLGRELANMIVDTYLEAEFQGGRHADRIKKIHEIETM